MKIWPTIPPAASTVVRSPTFVGDGGCWRRSTGSAGTPRRNWRAERSGKLDGLTALALVVDDTDRGMDQAFLDRLGGRSELAYRVIERPVYHFLGRPVATGRGPLVIEIAHARRQLAGLEAQLRRLNEVGCERVFQERVSSVAKRDQLAAALDCVRDGDVLVVTKLDRLARSVAGLVDIGRRIEGKSASLRILDRDLDTKTPTGRLMLNLIGSIAQF
jgi:Resolvase, N terminal domain